MNTVRLTALQLRYVNKTFWRNPASAFFTFAFPLMFLVIFTALLGHGRVLVNGREIHQSTYYVAQMGAFAVITACYNNIAIGLTFQRDTGVLKRMNGTPLPALAYFAARVLHAMLMALLLVAITVTFGRAVYDADIPSGASLLRFLAMVVIGSAAFCALGFAVTAMIPNFDAAAPIVNASILPLLFLSGVFIPLGDNAPRWIIWTAKIFPVRHFAQGVQAGFLQSSFHWTDVLVVAVWGLGGLIAGVRWFSWEPRA